MKRALAAAHLFLISPAVFFLLAVLVQRVQPLQPEPARTAQHIVNWYAGRMWTLWVLLLALPFSVLISGCLSLRRDSRARGQNASPKQKATAAPLTGSKAFVVATTATAAVIVGVVILHMLAN